MEELRREEWKVYKVLPFSPSTILLKEGMTMKKAVITIIVLTLLTAGLSAKAKSTIKFSGSNETTFDFKHSLAYVDQQDRALPDSGEFTWGFNSLTNFRLSAEIGDYLEFYSSFNLTLLAGSYTDGYKQMYAAMALGQTQFNMLLPTGNLTTTAEKMQFLTLPFYYKSTYVGSLDIDRLYFKINHDLFSVEAGLIRIARGFGYIFSPTDFFNPRNPINPTGRLDGKLGLLSKFYPLEFWRIELFAVAPDNPLEQRGWGFTFGHATNFYLGKVNMEFLYALKLPEVEYGKDPVDDLGLAAYMNNNFTHIAGFSLKADVEVGLFVDMIYRFEHRNFIDGEYYGRKFYGFEGLEAAIGIDYTIGGKVSLLFEYMFYGSGILHWQDKTMNHLYSNQPVSGDWKFTAPLNRAAYLNPEIKPQYYQRHNYLFGMIRGKVNDYLSMGGSYLFGIDDQSGLLTAFMEIEPFQAFTIKINAQYPFDWRMLNTDWRAGEFGATNLGFYQNYSVSCVMKF